MLNANVPVNPGIVLLTLTNPDTRAPPVQRYEFRRDHAHDVFVHGKGKPLPCPLVREGGEDERGTWDGTVVLVHAKDGRRAE